MYTLSLFVFLFFYFKTSVLNIEYKKSERQRKTVDYFFRGLFPLNKRPKALICYTDDSLSEQSRSLKTGLILHQVMG